MSSSVTPSIISTPSVIKQVWANTSSAGNIPVCWRSDYSNLMACCVCSIGILSKLKINEVFSFFNLVVFRGTIWTIPPTTQKFKQSLMCRCNDSSILILLRKEMYYRVESAFLVAVLWSTNPTSDNNFLLILRGMKGLPALIMKLAHSPKWSWSSTVGLMTVNYGSVVALRLEWNVLYADENEEPKGSRDLV